MCGRSSPGRCRTRLVWCSSSCTIECSRLGKQGACGAGAATSSVFCGQQEAYAASGAVLWPAHSVHWRSLLLCHSRCAAALLQALAACCYAAAAAAEATIGECSTAHPTCSLPCSHAAVVAKPPFARAGSVDRTVSAPVMMLACMSCSRCLSPHVSDSTCLLLMMLLCRRPCSSSCPQLPRPPPPAAATCCRSATLPPARAPPLWPTAPQLPQHLSPRRAVQAHSPAAPCWPSLPLQLPCLLCECARLTSGSVSQEKGFFGACLLPPLLLHGCRGSASWVYALRPAACG